jgi:hypothetical protein
MAQCPTGFSPNGEPRRECIRDGDEGEIISAVTFNDNATQWPFLATPFGRWEGPILIGRNPVLLPNRGLYFDGHDDFMRMYDLRLNFQMIIHSWVHVFSDEGHLFSLETSVPNTKDIFDQELAIKFGLIDGAQKIYGVWDAEDSTAACACGFLNKWKMLTFRFEKFNEFGAT